MGARERVSPVNPAQEIVLPLVLHFEGGKVWISSLIDCSVVVMGDVLPMLSSLICSESFDAAC